MTPPLTHAGFESPSLCSKDAGAGPAFELKFLIDESAARQVDAWARQRLALDPHGVPVLGGAYHTTSLYFDTPRLDVYHRMPSYRRRKYRIRRYGDADWTFLERKSKWGDRVEKRRTMLPDEELLLLAQPSTSLTWSGHWFQRRLHMRGLGPRCLIGYQRTAYVGTCLEDPVRLTFDRDIHGVLTDAWRVPSLENGRPLLADQVILELKFRNALPTAFKELIAEQRLCPRPVSKYRLCCEAQRAADA